MPHPPIYTIEYAPHGLIPFLTLLQEHAIDFIIDIRSRPHGVDTAEFARAILPGHLRQVGVRYAYLGDSLGERPADPACYTDGHVDYAKICGGERFQAGLQRLQSAHSQQLRVALLGAPGPANRCHRSLLVGAALADRGVPVSHIDAAGRLLPQAELQHDAAPATPPSLPPPTVDGARSLLRSVFGFDAFRPLQETIVRSMLAGRDTLAIMPTGSGKSLCYQLPALLLNGLTLVISPLIALMADQVDQLQAVGVAATTLNSTIETEEYRRRVMALQRGEMRLLYVAPETLLRPDLLRLLAQIGVAAITVDEAHCISEWGHDFRPEYRQIAAVRARFPDATCLALTATATSRVREDIVATLQMAAADVHVASFDRPNLSLNAAPRRPGQRQLDAFLNAHREQAGIIYATTRRDVETLARRLNERGFRALPYHAGLDDERRHAHQRAFGDGSGTIMVATIAFGMGINKPDIRFVVHYNLPRSIENYYQEIGRAGRDGLPADCLLLYGNGDLVTHRRMIDTSDEQQRQGALARLQTMHRFATTTACRRGPLLTYFGDPAPTEPCDNCDNCCAPAGPAADFSPAARLILQTVADTGNRFGGSHIVNVLCGSRSARVRELGHDGVPTYGAGRAVGRETLRHVIHLLVQQQSLTQNMANGGLNLGPHAQAVMAGAPVSGPSLAPQRAAAPAARAVRRQSDRGAAPDYDDALFLRLVQQRRQLAAEGGVPAYVVFPDRTLLEMAARRPRTVEALGDIYGVGEVKKARFGSTFVSLIDAYCRENDLA